jgi:hypothetical protein
VRRACRALRQIVAPAGAHRAPRLVEETVPVADLLRPVEAMVNDWAWCPAEKRETLHAFLRLGGRECWDCRTVTLHDPLTSAPRPDA